MTKGRRRTLRVPAGTQKSEIWKTIFGVAYRRVPTKRIVVAIILTLLLHVAVYFTSPKTLAIFVELSPAPAVELVEQKNIEIPEELLPEELRKKATPEFVPANLESVSKITDETNSHSAIDQRASQESPDPTTRSRKPKNDGELEDSKAVAQNLTPRELLPPNLRATRESKRGKLDEDSVSQEKKEFGVTTKENDDGNVALGNTMEKVSKEKKGVPDPQERPEVISPAGLNSITMKSNTATNEIGAVSLDAKYSEFGDYTQRMLEAIQAAWYLRIETGSVANRTGVVRVKFTLLRDGTLKDVKVLYSSASEAATYACVDAIESRAPFEVWRSDMVALIGEEQSSTISFYYR